METWRTDLDAWIARSGLSAAQVARRAGVSGSTIHRIRNGQTDPSLGTLREIAIACGLDLHLAAATLSDPLAAQAARVLLEKGYPDGVRPATEAWIRRLKRQAEAPLEIVTAAAVAANPFTRAGSIHFSGTATTAMLASAGSAAGGRWAVSGSPALEIPGRQKQFHGHALLWTERADLVAALLENTLRPVPHPTIATVTVVQPEPELFTGTFEVESISFVAPIQIVLDCIALGGEDAATATEIASSW
jgi:transcriptional regulator with XRE-family HTH domain